MANWVICSALANYERAQAIFVADEEPRSLAVVDLNLASIAQAHGQYRDALRRLHAVLEQTAAHCPRFGCDRHVAVAAEHDLPARRQIAP
jgi:hypothetical protein